MVNQLREQIIEANQAYRLGSPIMSDYQYDLLVEQLQEIAPHDPILKQIGHTPQDEGRKAQLPIEMASMNKVKSIQEIIDWCRLKDISSSELVIITPKYDGLSLCVNETTGEAWTRGDGKIGQKSDAHFAQIQNKLTTALNNVIFTYGEVMMPKATFLSKWSEKFANPRNLVAGLLNSKEATQTLQDCNYIRYGAHFIDNNPQTKEEVIDTLNSEQTVQVPYHICKVSDLTLHLMVNLFEQFSKDYEIDGLIIELNDLSRQNYLGRETSTNNPVWARAFKHPLFEQTAITEVLDISWNISKQGFLKPTVHINPVKLDGVTVSNVTGNNARFIKDMGIGKGAKVIVKRSGMVIPVITEVIQEVDFQMPNVENIGWNENGIELITLEETDDQRLKQVIAFFEILEADNVSEGVITQLWDAGYKTVRQILNLTKSDLEKIDRFGKRKAQIVHDSIKKAITGVQLSKLQHATGLFKNLGSKKLALLEGFKGKPTFEQIMEIDGFAEISAKAYLDGYDQFTQFIEGLPITIQTKTQTEKVGDDLAGMSFVFTGVRRPDLVEIISSRGGKEVGTISKNVTHLICADKNSTSSKMTKAASLGITILTVAELEDFLS